MFLLFGAFLAGMITVVAPCVLPLLPVIIGGSVSGNTADKKRPIVIALSLAVSLIIFTLLLKVTTLLINIPPQAISYVSGAVIILIGILSLFPLVYEKAMIKIGIQKESQKMVGKGLKNKNSLVGPIVIGAALGPVFSSCSPVYAYILATVLPVSFGQAFIYIISYVLGLSVVLLLIGFLGQRFVTKIRFASNPKGIFQRAIAVLFIVVGVLVFTGYDQKVQTYVSEHTAFNFDALSAELIPGANKNKPVDGKVYNVTSYKAPELTGLQDWINSKPLTLKQLKGKVVLVNFWTYSCINCIREHPYIEGWYNTYKANGLVVLGIHAPEFSFEKVPANVEQATKAAGLTYPIALDNDLSTWNAFHNNYWPATYLIDKQGNVRRVRYGEGEYPQTEAAIRGLLAEDGGTVTSKHFVKGQVDASQNPDQTPETYLGAEKALNYAGQPRLTLSPNTAFTPAATLPKDGWTLGGNWAVDEQTITSQSLSSTLTFNVTAKQAYVVASSPTPQAVSVSLNGQPISQTNSAGSDVKNSQVEVREARLYRLMALPKFTKNSTLKLTVPAGVNLNVFTFGS